MLNLQFCGGGKRLIFCNGAQNYNVFLNWKNFFLFFSIYGIKKWSFLVMVKKNCVILQVVLKNF